MRVCVCVCVQVKRGDERVCAGGGGEGVKRGCVRVTTTCRFSSAVSSLACFN